MRVAIIAPTVHDKIASSLARAVDVHTYKGFNDVSEFLRQQNLAKLNSDRVFIIDNGSITKNDLYGIVDLSETSPDTIFISLISTDHPNILEKHQEVLNSHNTLVISTDRVSATFMVNLLNMDAVDLFQKYDTNIQVNVVTATVSEDTRESFNTEGDLDFLNLADAGESHADTGFLDEDFDGGNFPDVKKTRWNKLPSNHPGYDINDHEHPYPYIPFSTRAVIVISENNEASTHAAILQAGVLAEKGHYSVLYGDLQSGRHGINSHIKDLEAFEIFSPSIQDNTLYQMGSVFFASNGLTSDTTDADVMSVIDKVDKFDHTVFDMTFDKMHMIPAILAQYPDTPIIWAIKGTGDGLIRAFNSLFGSKMVHSAMVEQFQSNMFVHPGVVEDSFCLLYTSDAADE